MDLLKIVLYNMNIIPPALFGSNKFVNFGLIVLGIGLAGCLLSHKSLWSYIVTTFIAMGFTLKLSPIISKLSFDVSLFLVILISLYILCFILLGIFHSYDTVDNMHEHTVQNQSHGSLTSDQPKSLIGEVGQVVMLNGSGYRVVVHGQDWQAYSSCDLKIGDTVQVTNVDGSTLVVDLV